jgi:hypothetical protein
VDRQAAGGQGRQQERHGGTGSEPDEHPVLDQPGSRLGGHPLLGFGLGLAGHGVGI